MTRLLFAGEGWGGKAAYRSLLRTGIYEIDVLTKDDSWQSELQQSGVECVKSFGHDYTLTICAGWRGIIRQDILSSRRILNIHYSLLPTYRGLHSTVWAILNDEPFLGLTIHRMNAQVDDGPIVYQYKIANDLVKSAPWYMEHFNEYVENVLGDVIRDYLAGRIAEVEQDATLASWVGKRSYNDCRIDFSRDLNYQKAFFRALSAPYPLPWFKFKNELLEVRRVSFHDSPVVTHLGRILNIDHKGIWISCVGGYIICESIFQKEKNEELPLGFFKRGEYVDANS